ncbi:hypothetical protein Bca52824_020868 [Brassica carinata]|uniref:pectinesterase n=1 Tax=Brassica carinata TaxID=52824 RepID=A0A8X7VU52_BRACI|nr:hypothetical protein Bca52824_020868 [Brassica carinata]
MENDAPVGMAFTSDNQSMAAFVAADKVAFYHCAFFSLHNTLFDNKGSIDFIFGRATSIFNNCEIIVVSDKLKPYGSITAHHRENTEENTGYVYLGRAKGRYSRVIFAKTYLSKTVVPHGWTNWSYDSSTKDLYHAEYKCHGPGAERQRRSEWAKELITKQEVECLLSIDFIDGTSWLPVWLQQKS